MLARLGGSKSLPRHWMPTTKKATERKLRKRKTMNVFVRTKTKHFFKLFQKIIVLFTSKSNNDVKLQQQAFNILSLLSEFYQNFKLYN